MKLLKHCLFHARFPPTPIDIHEILLFAYTCVCMLFIVAINIRVCDLYVTETTCLPLHMQRLHAQFVRAPSCPRGPPVGENARVCE